MSRETKAQREERQQRRQINGQIGSYSLTAVMEAQGLWRDELDNAALFVESDDMRWMYDGRRLNLDVKAVAILLVWASENPGKAGALAGQIEQILAAGKAHIAAAAGKAGAP